MFETFNVPGLYIAVQPILALAAGYTTTKVSHWSLALHFCIGIGGTVSHREYQIELLLNSAFVQPPADQTPDSSPPAFKHVLRQPIIENG
jgi:actin-related protein